MTGSPSESSRLVRIWPLIKSHVLRQVKLTCSQSISGVQYASSAETKKGTRWLATAVIFGISPRLYVNQAPSPKTNVSPLK